MLNLPISKPALVRCVPFGIFIAALALRDALDGLVDTRWLYAAQAGATALALGLLWHHYSELRDEPGGAPAAGSAPGAGLRGALIAIVSGVAIAALWVSLDASWMRIGEPTESFAPLDEAGELHWGLIAVRLAGACLVVPVMEELFWRSFLMRWLDRREFLEMAPRRTSAFALLASSAAFALAHDLWLAGFIAGLAFGLLYRQTGRIWLAIGAHAVANLALGLYVVQQRAWVFW